MDIFFDCMGFLTETSRTEFGQGFDKIEELEDVMELGWAGCETDEQMKTHIENALPHVERLIDFVADALAGRNTDVCGNLDQYLLMVTLQLNVPVSTIAKYKKNENRE
jgi:hypothetical protein